MTKVQMNIQIYLIYYQKTHQKMHLVLFIKNGENAD